MSRQRNALLERFFTAAISGDRHSAREIMDELFTADTPAERIASHLIWPTMHQVQAARRADQLSSLAYHYATRLMRSITDQLQLRYEQHARRDQTVLVMSGPEESEELTGQLAADLLEADGYTVYYCGGGVSNDEIVGQLADLGVDKLVVFGSIPATVPQTRLLIDRLHDLGVCPELQIIVGGGVFNRAEGLAEEIGADLWASDPIELVETIAENTKRRMSPDQRTVGRKRRPSSKRAAA
ncbi:MAG: B12-binding domain-containing protein [Planctomycetota bacterium]